ncbi:MAG: energy-coupling factor transporter transmembrane component T [Erysipelotrichaceae bacterium]|nr:energy-coupling factor transporter transmembrane component T [Erysipelotrichaceae bacterium]MDP3304723.1 energy-coupling factor transporter transmembrane component T [Erysipelotrichaceae bacterium]
MKDKFLINIVPGDTFLHKLSGTTKVRLFVALLVFITMSFDLRLILPVFILTLIGVISAKPNWKQVKLIMSVVLFFNLLNIFLFYVANPTVGEYWCGQLTMLGKLNNYFVFPVETFWYLFVRLIKMLTNFMVSLWFITTITPSEFAAGLYSLGVPYKVCTVVSLGFRYIPDIARDYENIKISMQLRGVEMDAKRTKITERLKQMVLILVPLIITSFDRVQTIANGMDLRGYGRNKMRTYYCEHESTKADKIFQFLTLILFIFSIGYIISVNVWPPQTRMWCPIVWR